MKRKNVILAVLGCAAAACAMIIVIELTMKRMDQRTELKGSPAVAKTALPADKDEDAAAGPVHDYEMDPKTGEKQFLR